MTKYMFYLDIFMFFLFYHPIWKVYEEKWNMFIVLSGTIESLRKQTEDRLFDDLHRDNCSIDWMPLDKPSSRSPKILKANAMRFNDRNHSYFVVSLKNKSRLKELMLWLQEDSNVQSQ